MFYQLNKGEDYDINGDTLREWLNTYKANLTNLTLEDDGIATIENLSKLCVQFRNLQSVDFTDFNTSNVTNIHQMFSGCQNIISVNGLNLPNCHNFDSTFSTCSNLINFPIKPKDFNDDTNYARIYSGCRNITEDVCNINVDNCTLNSLFEYCVNVTKIYNINISNSILSKPFIGATNITDIYDITISNCTWMSDLFKGMSKLQNIYNLNIDVSNLPVGDANLINMFYGCNNLSIISYANIANGLPDAYYTKSHNISNLGLNLANFTIDQIKILGNKYYIDAIPYIINSSNVSTYWNIYNGSAWTNIEKSNYDVTGTGLKSKISTIATTATNIYIEDTGNEGTLYYMSSLFSSKATIQVVDISNLKTEKVARADKLFQGCPNLISVSNFDTHNVISIGSMFSDCHNLTNVPNFNTSNVTSMDYMFSGCYNLSNVPNFNTSNVTNMAYMFKRCNNLSNVPEFNTSNVTCMISMFNGCINLTNVPEFNTSNVTHMREMFNGCNNLTNVPNFNTSNVTNMIFMFDGCNNLTNVPNFNTSNVTSMAYMFRNCKSLIDIPNFNTSNVTSMISMFAYCNNLSNASIQNIINMCLNSNITNSTLMNLNNISTYSPLYNTIFDSTYYQNRLDELTAAGWKY